VWRFALLKVNLLLFTFGEANKFCFSKNLLIFVSMTIQAKNETIDKIARKSLFPSGISDRDWYIYKFTPEYQKTLFLMEQIWEAAAICKTIDKMDVHEV
jgi:hypothetical protein